MKKELEQIKLCKLNGSVFIVARGGQSYKLGLVPVAVVEEDSTAEYLDSVFSRLESLILAETKRWDNFKTSLAEAANAANSDLSAYQKAKVEFAFSLTNLKRLASVNELRHQVIWEPRLEPSNQEYQASAAKFFSAAQQLKEVAGRLKPKIESMRAIRSDWLDSYNNVRGAKLSHFAMVFNNVPSSYLLKTDADGKFSVNLPRESSFVLAAKAQRMVGDESEMYYWWTTVEIPDKDEFELFLSNDNLVETIPNFSDRVYSIPGSDSYPPDLPSFDDDDVSTEWSFIPPLTMSTPQSAVGASQPQPEVATGRFGNVLVLGKKTSAEVLSGDLSATGLIGLRSGTKINIVNEDDNFIYFLHDQKKMRISKKKLPEEVRSNKP